MTSFSSPPVWLLTLIETVLNGVLRLQPDFMASVNTQLHDKIIQVQLPGPHWEFVLQPGAGGIRITAAAENPPDLTLRATPAALLKLAQGEWVSGPELEIHGDIQLARQLQLLVQEWDSDWEEWLARAFGDIPAYHISNMLRSGFNWGQETLNTVQSDLGEYLQYEAQTLPSPHAVQQFLQDVDELRDAVERLDARLMRVQHALNSVAR
ncbi:MAG: SCP2 sterol-binding domain-containing protein [Candidatus Competibacteraceae bacterium]|nr:SCP2 sterol-binding domain-containing protein [Candidatus Competibacteraceae bacterium]MCB1815866.1 SCP2 sterol-binding domain-containing protein [Candidatus Competibacteraceae bacterium]